MIERLFLLFGVSAALLAGDAAADRLELVNHVNLWSESPVRSPDASGVTYFPATGRLLIADSEITEYGDAKGADGRPVYEGFNVFEAPLDLSARLDAHLAASERGWPCEPVGLAYNPTDGFMYGTDDNTKMIYRYGYDAAGKFGTPLAQMRADFDGRYADPEGIACDSRTGVLYVASGTREERVLKFRFDAVADSFRFLGDFSLGGHLRDPEGIAVDPESGNLFLVAADGIAEFAPDGGFVQLFDYSYLEGYEIEYRSPGGLTFAPSSDPNDHADEQSLYITCRGIDNGAYPQRNSLDGAISEVRLVREPRLGRPLRVPGDHPTISAAVASSSPGDTILVAPGVYVDSVRISAHAVTIASRFLVSGDPADIDSTVLDGNGGSFVVMIDKAAGAGTVLYGLTLRHASDGVSSHASFDMVHCQVTGTSDGIDYEEGGGLVRYSHFYGNRDDAIDLDGSTAAVIEHCVIEDNGDDGIEIRLHPHQGPGLDVVIRNNAIRRNGEDGIQLIGYDSETPRSFVIEGNFITDNAMAGLGCMAAANTVEDYSGAALPESVRLVNNTFAGNEIHVSGGARMLVVNNLFVGAGTRALSRLSGSTLVVHNLFWDNGQDADESYVGSEANLSVDPHVNSDYGLQGQSPAIDAGVRQVSWEGGVVVLVQPQNVAGGGPDLGAFEH